MPTTAMQLQSAIFGPPTVFEIVTARMFARPPRTLHPEEITPALMKAQREKFDAASRAIARDGGSPAATTDGPGKAGTTTEIPAPALGLASAPVSGTRFEVRPGAIVDVRV